MVSTTKHDRICGPGALGIFATAVLVGAGATALALSLISRTKSPERILQLCESAAHDLQDRIEEIYAA